MDKTGKGHWAGHRQVELTTPVDVELPLGSWLVTPRRGYTHHGIYAGDGMVVHYAGLARSWRRGPVELVSLAEFCGESGLWIKKVSNASYLGQQAVRRALSRVGENRYRIVTNNCEHFCAWCLYGESRSPQIERWLALPRTMVSAMVAGFVQVFAIAPRTLAALKL